MQETRTPAQEAAEDLFFGHVVIIWARWFVILAGTILILWSATTTAEISFRILFVVALMAINFFLHGRYLMERPANRALLTVVSLIDVAIVTGIVWTWQGQGGIASPFFVFYYPVLLAFGLVFPPAVAAAYTVVALVAYVLAAFLADPSFVTDVGQLKALLLRLITLASVGGLATFYWRIQRGRRRAAYGGLSRSQEFQPRLSPGKP